MNGRLDDDSGFTLIELLISIAMTAIILTVLTASFLVFFKNASYTTGRDDHAAGAEVLSVWLNRDLASATSAPTATSAIPCSATTTLLKLDWPDWTQGAHPDDYPTSSAPLFEVRYMFGPDDLTAGRCMISRAAFSGADAAHLTQQGQTLVLMRDLIGSAQANFSASTGNTAACPNTGNRLAVTVSLSQYHSSTASDSVIPYSYSSCINARTNGPAAIS